MAFTTGFKNYEEIKTVCLESLCLDTPCDEKNVRYLNNNNYSRLYDLDSAH